MFLHCDLDSFYVSVERAENPRLKTKPVIVGGNVYGRGVVASASYEAREYGIYAGMPITEAKRRFKNLIIINPDFKKYKAYSDRFFSIIYSITPDFEIVSCDEVYIDFSFSVLLHNSPLDMAKKIKEKTLSILNMPVSIGIGSTKYLAKIASKYAKPDGIFEIKHEKNFIINLSINVINGIGKKFSRQLNSLGVYRVGDVLKYDFNFWKTHYKSKGIWLYQLANNNLKEYLKPITLPKSMGHSETFPQNLSFKATLNYLYHIASILAYNMRKRGLAGNILILKVRYDNFSTFLNQTKLSEYTFYTDVIYKTAKKLFMKYENYGGLFRLVGITMSNLMPSKYGMMQSLFNKNENEKKYRLYKALDKLKTRWGENIILNL